MSSAIEDVKSVAGGWKRHPWSLWGRQILSILRLEVKKNFLGKRAILIYLLALAPVFLMAAFSIAVQQETMRRQMDIGQLNIVFANIYEGFILRTVVFFGCAWIFMNLFRGEVVDKSLHYYFLSPVRREVLVVGKYLSGLVTGGFLFVCTTALSLFFIYLAFGYPQNVDYLLDGPGLVEVFTYLCITVLACVGYGAFFLAIGLVFRNPIIPALMAYGWEWLNFLLPPMLKKISVIHYLHSLAPVPVPEGPFAIVAEPTPAWISVPGFLIVITIVMLLASFQIRRMQISYSGE
jgi:ABC-type transport system involved in multi-copper enzyme maturation permease subunit